MSPATPEQRIDRIRAALSAGHAIELVRGAALALAFLVDTSGRGHPLVKQLESAIQANDWQRAKAAGKAVVELFEDGALTSPGLRIAHEIEGTFLDIADGQVKLAERLGEGTQKRSCLAISAFLAGAVLEDALRRLCDANDRPYDSSNTSLSKLQGALYRPSEGIEIISVGENKQITAWGDTRNNADHGRFEALTHSEVLIMTIGVRAFLAKHLP